MSVLRYFIYTSGHSLFSREKRALLVAGRVAPLFTRRGEPAAAAARLGGARVAGRPLRVESLRARLAAAELEEKTAAERLRELQDRDAAQLIQDL